MTPPSFPPHLTAGFWAKEKSLRAKLFGPKKTGVGDALRLLELNYVGLKYDPDRDIALAPDIDPRFAYFPGFVTVLNHHIQATRGHLAAVLRALAKAKGRKEANQPFIKHSELVETAAADFVSALKNYLKWVVETHNRRHPSWAFAVTETLAVTQLLSLRHRHLS